MKFFVFITIGMQFDYGCASNFATNNIAGGHSDSYTSSISDYKKPSRYSHNPYAYRVIDEDLNDDNDDEEFYPQNVNSLTQSNPDSTSTPTEFENDQDSSQQLNDLNQQDTNTVNQYYDSEPHTYDRYGHRPHAQPRLRARVPLPHSSHLDTNGGNHHDDYYNSLAYGVDGYGHAYNGYDQTYHQQPYRHVRKRNQMAQNEHKKVDSKWTIFIRNYPKQWQNYGMVKQELERNNICNQKQIASVVLSPILGAFGFINLASNVNQEQGRDICNAMTRFYGNSHDKQATFLCHIQPNHRGNDNRPF